MVFGFGLIHGFGLATRLQDIGLPDDGLTPRLLAFNAGVELGQIAALIAMTALLALVRRTAFFGPFTTNANAFLVIAGSLLFLMQMHGYQHTAYPDDFGFSTSNHILDHYNNDVPSGDQLDQPPMVPPAAPPSAAPDPAIPSAPSANP